MINNSVVSNVTVIIPCFNDGKYIIEALQSLYVQTVLPERIIIVDDGSDAATKKVLKNIKYSSVEIIYQENKGVSNARNTGINLATTNYILTLDADDYFEPTFIEKSVEILNNNSNTGIVGCYAKLLKYDEAKPEIGKPLGGKARDFLIKNNGLASSMFRKECWEQVSGYDENMTNGYEDWEFWLSVLRNNWVMYIIPEVQYNYRIKKKSRDTVALQEYDFELRAYIFSKHKELYKEHFYFYATELIRQNSILRNNVNKVNKSIDYKIGKLFLIPMRFFKRIVNLKK